MKTPIMLRINRASAKGDRITATFTHGNSRRRATFRDAEKHGFQVPPTDAADVLALIRAQVELDNAKLGTGGE